MKKVSMLALTMIMAVSLSACGEKKEEATNGAAAQKKIMFATDASYAPMESMDKDKIVGFDIDFLAEVMKEAKLEYEVKNIGWDTMLESVKQGTEYQAGISSISITDERKGTYDFSIPYFESTNMILVKEGSTIKNALDLKDKKVAVQGATTADDLMMGIMGSTNSNLKKFDSNVLAFMELEKGGVDAAVADIAIVNEYAKNNPNKKFVTIPDNANFGAEFYGIAYPKGSDLKAKLDPAIKAVLENGTYAKVYEKWFGAKPNVDVILKAK
ncbi:MAG: basic amino acid transporter substrate-binding protein [Paenibacillaceae bacterium]|jgi:polar amino acid transport system substrate-binding protein|nr:basic amino acid transporter substrate-binding protein [Paenibacillaceae bacterium]